MYTIKRPTEHFTDGVLTSVSFAVSIHENGKGETREGGTGTDASTNGATNTGVGSVLITWNYTAADPKTYIGIPLVGAGSSVIYIPDLRLAFI